ncbi:hypothetical protein GY69_005145 [Salmonella enterica subsp. enterica]|nr:hypothetical protein [Salmonella enterica]EBS0228670.1 hypothetical protein [Salmonella enterica subsp. enterica serovar Schwarzengrund]EBY9401878.1 hypothetical protein [Salmonella enterica subsp. enterica serovar Kisarawe]EDS6474248.1 hypothetical protein [Salmonella enterica subsp. enterica]EDV0863950.1 hypothetical protein [Salmonella enterica subsp. enterica]
MSVSLTLQERLKQQHLEQNEIIQNLTREQLIALRKELNDILSKELNTMQVDMQNQIKAISPELNRRKKDLIWRLTASRVLIPGLTTMSVLGAIWLSGWGLSTWQENKINQNWQTLREQKQALDIQAEKGGRIQWNYCGDQKRLCLKIDKNGGTYGKNGENYKIPLGY